MCQLLSKIFILRQVSAVRASLVTDNLRGRYQTCNMSFPEMVLYRPLKLLVTEEVLTAETSVTIKILLRNRHSTSQIHRQQKISFTKKKNA